MHSGIYADDYDLVTIECLRILPYYLRINCEEHWLAARIPVDCPLA